MPQAVQADWNLIREMYTNGLSLKEIHAQTGVQQSTVSCRASRAGWRSTATKAKAIVKASQTGSIEAEADIASLTKQSQRTRTALADVLVRSAEKLASQPIKSAKHALIVNQEAESMVRNAKTVYGWSEGQSQPSVRINVMGTVSVHSGSETGSKPVPALDNGNAQAIALDNGTVIDQG